MQSTSALPAGPGPADSPPPAPDLGAAAEMMLEAPSALSQLPQNCLDLISFHIDDLASIASWRAVCRATSSLSTSAHLQHFLLHRVTTHTPRALLQRVLQHTPCSKNVAVACLEHLLPRLGPATPQWCMVAAWACTWVVTLPADSPDDHAPHTEWLSRLLLFTWPADVSKQEDTATAPEPTASPRASGASDRDGAAVLQGLVSAQQGGSGLGGSERWGNVMSGNGVGVAEGVWEGGHRALQRTAARRVETVVGQQACVLALVLAGCMGPLPLLVPPEQLAADTAASNGYLHGVAAVSGEAYARLVLGLAQQAARRGGRREASRVLSTLLDRACLGHRGEVNPMAWAVRRLRELSPAGRDALLDTARQARLDLFGRTHPTVSEDKWVGVIESEMLAVTARLTRLLAPPSLPTDPPQGSSMWGSTPTHPRPYWCWALHDATVSAAPAPAASRAAPAGAAHALSWLWQPAFGAAGSAVACTTNNHTNNNNNTHASNDPDAAAEDLWLSPLPLDPQANHQRTSQQSPFTASRALQRHCPHNCASGIGTAVRGEPGLGHTGVAMQLTSDVLGTGRGGIARQGCVSAWPWYQRGSWDTLIRWQPLQGLAPGHVWCLNNTPAYIAAYHGQIGVLKSLLTDGTSQVHSAMEGAACGGQTWLLKELTRPSGPYQACIYTWTHQAIVRASSSGHTRTLHWLIHQSEIEPPHEMLYQLCLHAVRSGRLGVVRYMVKHHGITPSVWEPQATMLQLACWRGHTHILRALVRELGAKDLNDAKGFMRALVLAAHQGHVTVIEALLDLAPSHLPHTTPALRVALCQQHSLAACALLYRLTGWLFADSAPRPSTDATATAEPTGTTAAAESVTAGPAPLASNITGFPAGPTARSLLVSLLARHAHTLLPYTHTLLATHIAHSALRWAHLTALTTSSTHNHTTAAVSTGSASTGAAVSAGVFTALYTMAHALGPVWALLLHSSQRGTESRRARCGGLCDEGEIGSDLSGVCEAGGTWESEIGVDPAAQEDALWGQLEELLTHAHAHAHTHGHASATTGISAPAAAPAGPAPQPPAGATGVTAAAAGDEGTWIEYRSANKGWGAANYQVLAKRGQRGAGGSGGQGSVGAQGSTSGSGRATAKTLKTQKIQWRVEFSMMDVQEASRAYISDTIDEAHMAHCPEGLWDKHDKSMYRRWPR